MTKKYFYWLVCCFSTLFACQSAFKTTPKLGDAVLYEYIVKQGDSIVFKGSQQIGDTATMIIEALNIKSAEKGELVSRLLKMSVNDTVQFDVTPQQKGFLRLYRIIPAEGFGQYIEASRQRETVVAQELQAIKQTLMNAVPLYQNRRKMVLDSAKTLFDQYDKGQLEANLKTLETDSRYYLLKGNGQRQVNKRRWVWFHFVTRTPEGVLVDSYNNLPRMTNLAEFALNEQLEKAAATFDKGNAFFLTVAEKNATTTAKQAIYWVEVVEVLYF